MNQSNEYARVRPLADLGELPPEPLPWVRDAWAQEPERSTVFAAGAQIETLCWGRKGAPGLLFLHGTGANAEWWSHIAPFFAQDWRCAAFSLSGMGRSSHRDRYSLDLYADEVEAVIEAAGLAPDGARPVIVAHSFGSLVAMKAGGRPGVFSGLISLDAAIFQEIMRGDPDVRTYRENEIFPNLGAALARFRLRPHQPLTDVHIVDRIAREGLKELPDGRWTWRAAPFIRRDIVEEDIRAVPGGTLCPVFQIWGGKSVLSIRPGAIEVARSQLPADTPQMVIPEAGHHAMLDYPLELVAALRAILATWPR